MNAEQRQLLDNMINVISAIRSSLAFLCTKTVNGVLPGKAEMMCHDSITVMMPVVVGNINMDMLMRWVFIGGGL